MNGTQRNLYSNLYSARMNIFSEYKVLCVHLYDTLQHSSQNSELRTKFVLNILNVVFVLITHNSGSIPSGNECK